MCKTAFVTILKVKIPLVGGFCYISPSTLEACGWGAPYDACVASSMCIMGDWSEAPGPDPSTPWA